MSEIIDFSDLAKDVKFSFKGVVYVIPSITNGKAKELFKLGKKERKKEEDNNEEEIDTSFYDDFITASVTFEDGSPVTVEHINKEWPMKLSLKVVKLINESISAVGEGTEEEKN